MEDKTPVPIVPATEVQPVSSKMSKLKVAFLYVLIGGLVLSALISVVSILIGEFNDTASKALLTTLTVVTHSLLVIAIVSADKNNRLGKDIVSTTIMATVIANMFTATLGTWNLWASDASWKAFLVYMLVIGVAFIVTACLKLRLPAHKTTNYLVYATTGLVILMAILLLPWIIASDASWVNSFYYRLIGAASILAATTFSVLVIINRIAISQNPLLATKEIGTRLSSGMRAIYITVGVVVGLFWFYGIPAFIASSSYVNRDNSQPDYSYPSKSSDTRYQ